MNRRGMALVATLWFVAIISGAAAMILGRTWQEVRASQNRRVLTRSGWARDACISILRQRRGTSLLSEMDTVHLGRDAWCMMAMQKPAARIHLNSADSATLQRLVNDPARVAALLDWRDTDTVSRSQGAEWSWYRSQRRDLPRNGPLMSVEELRFVRGFDSTAITRIRAMVTVRGDGVIDLNSAPEPVLKAVGLPAEAVQYLLASRGTSYEITSLDALIGNLSPTGRANIDLIYQQLVNATVFSPPVVIATVSGGVGNSLLTAECIVEMVPRDGRLGIRSMECP